MFNKDRKLKRICNAYKCKKEGVYPAPKSRNELNNYNFFCIDHIRDFNKSWNYFEGLNEDQLELEIRNATTWERPSWKFGTKNLNYSYKKQFKFDANKFELSSEKSINPELMNAWNILDLEPNTKIDDVKKKYKLLAKKWHPDTSLDCEEKKKYKNEKFVIITNAYKKIVKSILNKNK